MTRINRLVMRGFKSFADKTEMIFDKDYNVILGPNGSGKSNVLDAVCFVIGKSSAKSLRAEKTGNLVYNGGKKNKGSKEAEVSIYFDNKNKIFPMQEKEIKISRIVRKDGASVYKINDIKRTRANILELLQYAKIDPDGYNIILQGDIVRLIEANGVERRQIIEEISGISVYEDKKQKAMSALENVDVKLNESEIILAERQKSLQELKKEHDQAIKYKDVQEKQKSHEAALLLKNIEKYKSDIEIFEKELIDKRSLIDKNQEAIDKYQKEIDSKNKIVNNISDEIEQKGEKDQVDLHKKVEQLKVDIATNKNKIDSLDEEIKKSKSRKEQLEESIKEINTKLKELNQKKEQFLGLKDKKESQLTQTEDKISGFRKKYELDSGNDLDKKVTDLDSKSDVLDKKIHDLREQQQTILREKDKSEFKLQSLDGDIAKVKEVEKEHKVELMNLKARKEDFKKTTIELSKVLSNDSHIAAKLGKEREISLKLNEDIAKLNAKKASINESLKGSQAVEKIISQKDKFQGVIGRVSDLADVPRDYALALEIAAGGKVKHIVVDSDATAARCIKYLKDNRLGSATFIPINKIRSPNDVDNLDKIKKMNGVIGLARELISYDSKYDKVFRYIFGSTIVVESIEVARKIGIGTTKMVTLDGDLTEISGVMKGGFLNKNNKTLAFSQGQINKDLEKYQIQSSEISGRISNLELEKQENEEKISSLRSQKAELEGEIIKIEKSLHLDTNDLEASFKIREEEENKLRDLDKQFDEVMEKISLVNRELAQVKMQRQSIRDQINKVRNPRVIAELNTFEEKKNSLKEEISNLTNEIKGLDLQLNNVLNPEQEKTLKLIKQSDNEIKSYNDSISDLKEKIKKDSEYLKIKEKEEKEFYEKFKEMFNKRSNINDEIKKLEMKIISTEEYIRRTQEKISSISIDKTRIQTELKSVEEDYKEYEGVEPIKNKSIENLKQSIYNYKKNLESMGFVNLKSLQIYESVKKEYESLTQKRDVLVKEKEEILLMMSEIESKKKEMFMTSFEELNSNFKRIFQKLSKKGDAFLELLNPEDPFSDGVVIKVRLSGEKFLDIRSLSGGEKTMTALAFIFSVQEYSPASFYVLDEVDAALDKRNADLLGELIRKYSERAQYVVISHNDEVINKGDNLYGVSMNEQGISKIVSLKV